MPQTICVLHMRGDVSATTLSSVPAEMLMHMTRVRHCSIIATLLSVHCMVVGVSNLAFNLVYSVQLIRVHSVVCTAAGKHAGY
jgi:hypothetical protein